MISFLHTGFYVVFIVFILTNGITTFAFSVCPGIMNVTPFASLVVVWFVLVKSEPICDHTEFLHRNGSCVACPVCGPGEQLSEDCGFGDGGIGVCVTCEEGQFSSDTGVAPCRRCTKCHLLNRLQKRACVATGDALCGRCLPGYYELRSLTGEVEPPCVPCYNYDTAHEECSRSSKTGRSRTKPRYVKEPEEKKVKGETFSMVLIGSATASSIFLVALLLWAFLLTAERFKTAPELCDGPEGALLSEDLQYIPLPNHAETAEPPEPPEVDLKATPSAGEPSRGTTSLSHDNEMHPTSIVINVTTNIKPSAQSKENSTTEEQQSSCEVKEMEKKLQTIWEMAQGHSVEMLSYDSVQDLSLLLDSADNRPMLRRLGQSLGVPPQVITHLRGFQDLFQYLRTSTYTLLPQLAQAAALLPNPQVVAKLHHAVVNKYHLGPNDVLP